MRPDHQRILGSQREGGAFAPRRSYRGRWTSWAAVVTMMIGMAVIALGVVLGPSWIVVVVGVVVILVGGVVAYRTDLMADVVLDRPRQLPEEPHVTPRGRVAAEDEDRRAYGGEEIPERRRDHPRGTADEPNDV